MVNWLKVNPGMKRNLPLPDSLPIQGCPADPHIYLDSPNPQGRIMQPPLITEFERGLAHTIAIKEGYGGTKEEIGPIQDTQPRNTSFTVMIKDMKGNFLTRKNYHPFIQTSPNIFQGSDIDRNPAAPFGRGPGFYTNLGVVSPPSEPLHGYVYTGSGWILHATPPG